MTLLFLLAGIAFGQPGVVICAQAVAECESVEIGRSNVASMIVLAEYQPSEPVFVASPFRLWNSLLEIWEEDHLPDGLWVWAWDGRQWRIGIRANDGTVFYEGG